METEVCFPRQYTYNFFYLKDVTKVNTSHDSIRKARESHLIYKANTLENDGMNKRDGL